VLNHGGTLYIDEGKPVPGLIEATVRNLREVAPTIYFNVPRGYEALLPFLRADAGLRKTFFSRLKLLQYAAAVLPHAGVVLLSFATEWYGTVLPGGFTLEHYRAALGHELTLTAISNSLKYASLATLLDVVLGVCVAYVNVRTRMLGRHLMDAMAMLPLAVPGIVTRIHPSRSAPSIGSGLTTRTSHGSSESTRSAVLPMKTRPRPDREIAPITTMPARIRRATAGIASTAKSRTRCLRRAGIPAFLSSRSNPRRGAAASRPAAPRRACSSRPATRSASSTGW